MSKNSSVLFQAVDWKEFDVNDVDIPYYKVIIFGRTELGKTIACEINDYCPYFLVCIPKNFTKKDISSLISLMKLRVKTKYHDSIRKIVLQKGMKYSSFNNYKYFNFLKISFSTHDAMKNYSYVFDKKFKIKGNFYSIGVYESNVIPVLKIIHERKLDSCGWINVEKYNTLSSKCYKTDIKIVTSYNNIDPVKNDKPAKLIIAAFDIECVSATSGFPDPANKDDLLIQIGTTFNRLGEMECFYKHIAVLGSCDSFDKDTIVETSDKEKDVILLWAEMLSKMSPDIIVGHNVYGFDYRYIQARAARFGIEHILTKLLSKITTKSAKFEELKLVSAALGSNKYYYYDTHGIVNFDFMKVVCNDPYTKLERFSLDHIASVFIREKIIKIEYYDEDDETAIITKNGLSLTKDRYICIISSHNSGDVYYTGPREEKSTKEVKKIKVSDVKNNEDGTVSIIVEGLLDDIKNIDEYGNIIDKKNDVYWCKAKDEMDYKEMFKKHFQTSKDRAEIAKYCVQDCVLVNILMEKLKIVMKSIAIANVCNVPMSYVHLKGQGVKIFSLVVKFCNENKFFVPVLKKTAKVDLGKGMLDETNFFNHTVTMLVPKEEEEEVKQKDGTIKKIKVLKKVSKIKVKKNASQNKFSKWMLKEAVKKYEKLCFIDDEKANLEKIELEQKYGGKLTKEKKKKYEGAANIPPVVGIYYSAIWVLDYLSLYPSSIIHRNMSAETLVKDPKYLNLPDYTYYKVRYVDKKTETKKGTLFYEPPKMITSIFAKKKDGTMKGMLPSIESYLLRERKKIKDRMKTEKDPSVYAMLDALQYAYKIVANSLYGQTGSDFSGIYNIDIAASTTSTGREMLLFAKLFAEKVYQKILENLSDEKEVERLILLLFSKKIDEFLGEKIINELKKTKTYGIVTYEYFRIFYEKDTPTFDNDIEKQKAWIHSFRQDLIKIIGLNKYRTSLTCIYGDTDSIFADLRLEDIETGKKITDKIGLDISIKLAKKCSEFIYTVLPAPHELQYEKTFWPFCIISKKRYTANKYEFDTEKYSQVNMGIVLKRRDYAPISKIVLGGLIDLLLNDKNPSKAIDFVKKKIKDIFDGKYPIENFIISKSVKDTYADRNNHAHVVTMDKRKKRDNADTVSVGDRVPFVYTYSKDSKKKGFKRSTTADDPIYVKKNNIAVDYEYYVTNQIRKPVEQFLSLITPYPEKIFDRLIADYLNDKAGIKSIFK